MKSEATSSEEEVVYVSRRIAPENAGGAQDYCSKCGEAVPAIVKIDDEVRRRLAKFDCPIHGVQEWEVYEDEGDGPEFIVCMESSTPYNYCGHDAYRVISDNNDEVRNEDTTLQTN